ncbi:PQQ-binding-like beta-propeller repeat protein [Oceanobacillus sp. 143]|nr:PQQ-binding-like beta-propeller repeat protein [Oceanobacillus sp. 143]
MYVTTGANYVFAFDAVTGEEKWRWEPPQELLDTLERQSMPMTNRGVAVGEGKVFMITGDVGLVSIDQETGETIDRILLSDYFPTLTPENGYYETTAPIYYDGKIFVGSSGGDNGVRGFEMAFNSSDLSPAWDEPFWTVPLKEKIGWRKAYLVEVVQYGCHQVLTQKQIQYTLLQVILPLISMGKNGQERIHIRTPL